MVSAAPWTVLDLFSGAGGMSAGFAAHPKFEVVGAVDMQVAKPSSGNGGLQCNLTYQHNIGVEPWECDLSDLSPQDLKDRVSSRIGARGVDVLASCAPCTGFSRVNPDNHLRDDPRNSLVGRTAVYAEVLRPRVILLENARELLSGRFAHHFAALRESLEALGYRVRGDVHLLSRFGLPQRRERALVVAVGPGLEPRTLEDLWDGYEVRPEATWVRSAISGLPALAAGEQDPGDPMHVSPSLGHTNLRRLQLVPHDGGSWADLRFVEGGMEAMTPAMLRTVRSGRFGSHPDVYGRMWWDRPAITIKRECGHVGNGRYAHPEQDRLCTVREMALLQGFPGNYQFVASGLTNLYRHIGDAVPPLISFQIAWATHWALTGRRPSIESVVLPGTTLAADDLQPSGSLALVG